MADRHPTTRRWIMARTYQRRLGVTSGVRRSRSYVLLGISIIGLVALMMLATVLDAKPNTIRYELAKTLMQAGLIVVVSAVIAFLTSEYQRQQVAADYARDVLKSTLDRATANYNGAKRARRLLRALALSGEGDDTVVLAGPYDLHMALINDIQLEFETLAREVQTRTDIFSGPRELADLFDRLDKYLGHLITEYEEERPCFAGEPPQKTLSQRSIFRNFWISRGFGGFAHPFHDVQDRLRADLAAVST